MAIRVITGKPGGGKSYWTLMAQVIEELVFGSRVIGTNMPLKLDELNVYLQKRFPGATIDLHQRVRLFTETETRFFFAHRHHGCDFEIPDPEAMKRNPELHIDYGDVSQLLPMLYIIDEAHICFDARAWMNSGPHLTYYNSQHRKFGDEVFFVTQFTALLDKRCVGFAQEFIEVRNYGMERLSIFRGPNGQHCATYITPEPGGRSGQVVRTEFFRLNKEIAACYDTTSGVGISGRSGAPREKQIKALSPTWALVGLAAVVVGTLKGMDGITWLIEGGAKKVVGVGDAAVRRVSGSLAKTPSDAGPEILATNNPDEAADAVVGVMVAGNATLVATRGSGWSAIARSVTPELLLLENGAVVRRRDVVNPTARGRDLDGSQRQ